MIEIIFSWIYIGAIFYYLFTISSICECVDPHIVKQIQYSMIANIIIAMIANNVFKVVCNSSPTFYYYLSFYLPLIFYLYTCYTFYLLYYDKKQSTDSNNSCSCRNNWLKYIAFSYPIYLIAEVFIRIFGNSDIQIMMCNLLNGKK